LIRAEDKLALISANGLTVPPDSEEGDRLVTFLVNGTTEDEVYEIVNKPAALKQGRTALYYECQLRPIRT
jgi:cell division septal protein FtsQ